MIRKKNNKIKTHYLSALCCIVSNLLNLNTLTMTIYKSLLLQVSYTINNLLDKHQLYIVNKFPNLKVID